MTESRLQLALSSGLSVKDWTFDNVPRAALICLHSLEPDKVMTLLRVHDVPWSWSVSAVQWALACGSGWLRWKCEDYTADNYTTVQRKQQATELQEWAHANGCPCTCGPVQQQQQQQQQQQEQQQQQ
jgi:glycerophosphoryl diester phosphodiesterase